jgi:hypothetical protein
MTLSGTHGAALNYAIVFNSMDIKHATRSSSQRIFDFLEITNFTKIHNPN